MRVSEVAHKKIKSPLELKLYQVITDFGLKVKPQYPVGPFFIDFAVPEIKLAIEVDGWDYHTGAKNRKRDEYRTKRLGEMGWKVERFIGWFAYRYPQVAVSEIMLKYLSDRITKEQKETAEAHIALFLAKDRNIDFAVRFIEDRIENRK